MRILKVEPGKLPYEKEIENTLEAMQAEVEGFIEVIPVGHDMVVVCNEEGKCYGMQPNRWLGNDIVCGPFFVAAEAYDEERNLASLNDAQLREANDYFSVIDVFTGNEPQLEPLVRFVELEVDEDDHC